MGKWRGEGCVSVAVAVVKVGVQRYVEGGLQLGAALKSLASLVVAGAATGNQHLCGLCHMKSN